MRFILCSLKQGGVCFSSLHKGLMTWQACTDIAQCQVDHFEWLFTPRQLKASPLTVLIVSIINYAVIVGSQKKTPSVPSQMQLLQLAAYRACSGWQEKADDLAGLNPFLYTLLVPSLQPHGVQCLGIDQSLAQKNCWPVTVECPLSRVIRWPLPWSLSPPTGGFFLCETLSCILSTGAGTAH